MFRKTSVRGKKRIPQINKLTALIVALVVVAVLGIFIIFSPFLKVKSIEISGDISCVEKGELVSKSNLLGKSILFISGSQLEKAFKEKYLCIQNLVINKKFPDKVLLEIKQREPFVNITGLLGATKQSLPDRSVLSSPEATTSSSAAIYKLDFSIKEASIGGKFLSDKEGLIYQRVQEENTSLPSVYIVDPEIGLGKTIPKAIVESVGTLVTRLKEMQYPLKDIKIIGDSILVDGATRLVFSLDGDLNRQLASLQLIWQKAKMNSKSIDQIDLRFDKPVLIYSNK